MANTYTWSIQSLQCLPSSNGQTNVVSVIGWELKGTDGKSSASIFGFQPVIYVAGEPFTDYSKLTEAQIIEWVKSAIGNDQIAVFQSEVDMQIELLSNPPVFPESPFVSTELPWSN